MLLAATAAISQTSTKSSQITSASEPAAKLPLHSDNSPKPLSAGPGSPAAVPLSKVVLKVHGVCESPAKDSAKPQDSCVTAVTRKQMETVIDVVQATGRSILPTQKRDVAVGYVDLLTGSAAAEKAGVDKDPRFAEVLRLARMKALSDMYRVRLQEEATKISAAEIESHYKENLPKFEELHLLHLSIPKVNSANLSDAVFATKARRLADEARQRALKGDDFDKIEKDVLESLAVKSPPPTRMAPIRRGVYAKEQEDMLFALKPGEVSKVLEQPSVYIIFKLVSRGTPRLDEVKDEIRSKLSREKLERLTAAVGGNVHAEFSEDYFGPVDKNAGRPMIEVPLPRKQQAAAPK